MAKLSKELDNIKNKYGETFMHICRDNFSTILEKEGLLMQILETYFAGNTKTLGEDIKKSGKIIEFKDYIYSKIDVEAEEINIINDKTPYEILDKAGYELIECTSEKEIQKYKKYYAPDEVICTIYNGGRLNTSIVFFAVKKNVNEIKRENFIKPQREDEYSTSVLGIQFDKQGMCMPHIISRYNHTVNNPNATYGNDLDRIAPGLTESFAKLLYDRGLKLNKSNIETFILPNYTVGSDGKYYKYNIEIDGIYYCPGNVIIGNGKVRIIENPESKMLVECFIIDKKQKTIEMAEERKSKDSFTDFFEFNKIKNISQKKDKNGSKIIQVDMEEYDEPVLIKINKDNQIISYVNTIVREIGENFLENNRSLIELSMPNVTRVEDYFLSLNESLTKLSMSNVIEIGNYFLYVNDNLKEIIMPNVTRVGEGFLNSNRELTKLSMPNVIEVGDSFLDSNENLKEIVMPNIKKIGNDFLSRNKILEKVDMPNVTKISNRFLSSNERIQELSMPNVIEIGSSFLYSNKILKELTIPNVIQIGNDFLKMNQNLIALIIPNIMKMGNDFLFENKILEKLSMLKVTKIGHHFLSSNQSIKELIMPEVTEIKDCFLYSNKKLTKLVMPNVMEIGNDFLYKNEGLTELIMPSVTEIEDNFLFENQILKKLSISNVERLGLNFLYSNKALTEVVTPKLIEIRNGFLYYNQSLTSLSVSNASSIPKHLLDIIEKNNIITSEDLAILDKEHNLTSNEVKNNKLVKFMKKITDLIK